MNRLKDQKQKARKPKKSQISNKRRRRRKSLLLLPVMLISRSIKLKEVVKR
jgi:hypothetical protein